MNFRLDTSIVEIIVEVVHVSIDNEAGALEILFAIGWTWGVEGSKRHFVLHHIVLLEVKKGLRGVFFGGLFSQHFSEV
jgi:hypothetical protein